MLATGIEVVFPAIHGPPGEDGQIQTLCESMSIAWVGCDATASTDCYDKVLFKKLMRAAGLPIAPFLAVNTATYHRDRAAIEREVARELGYPCIVKPSQSGSSLGLSRVESSKELEAAIQVALAFDDAALVEKLFLGRDVEIGVIENGTAVAGSPIELEYEGVLYDFEAKYLRGDRRYLPARCSAALLERLRQAALLAFQAARCSGMARVDLLVDPTLERFVVNEINTVPYMPESSTFTGSIGHFTGRTYTELIAGLTQSAWEWRGGLMRKDSSAPVPALGGSRT
jgi:D-alanine-D-alanine ligase